MPIRKFSETMTGPWLMELSDNQNYIVKFANELSDNSIIGELVCIQLAKKLDLPSVTMEFVDIDQEIINRTENLVNRKIQSGIHFATKFVNGSSNLPTTPFEIPIEKIANADKIPGIIAFDIFVCNRDRKAANSLIAPIDEGRMKFNYWMIDHGLCFGGNAWNANSLTNLGWELSGIPWNTSSIMGKEAFDPFIQQLKGLEKKDYQELVDSIPTNWNQKPVDLSKLVETLVNRSEDMIIKVLEDNKNKNNSMFPQWR